VTNHVRIIVVLLSVAAGLAGCRERESLPSPVVPTPAPSPVGASGLQPHISQIVPAASTTAGGAWGTISGAGFDGGIAVTFGGTALPVYLEDRSTLRFRTLPHPAGTVDVVVRNAGGRLDTLPGGHTFAPPESFDFNGVWDVYSGAEYEFKMQLVVENDALTSLTCGALPTVTFPASPIVGRGEFSYSGDDGLKVSGRLVSPTNAVGTINVAPCAPTWWADKR
jgi:hypothetical protein